MTFWALGAYQDSKLLYAITHEELCVHFGYSYSYSCKPVYLLTPDNFVPNQLLIDWGFTCIALAEINTEQGHTDDKYIQRLVRFWILEDDKWQEITETQFRDLGYYHYEEMDTNQ